MVNIVPFCGNSFGMISPIPKALFTKPVASPVKFPIAFDVADLATPFSIQLIVRLFAATAWWLSSNGILAGNTGKLARRYVAIGVPQFSRIGVSTSGKAPVVNNHEPV